VRGRLLKGWATFGALPFTLAVLGPLRVYLKLFHFIFTKLHRISTNSPDFTSLDFRIVGLVYQDAFFRHFPPLFDDYLDENCLIDEDVGR